MFNFILFAFDFGAAVLKNIERSLLTLVFDTDLCVSRFFDVN